MTNKFFKLCFIVITVVSIGLSIRIVHMAYEFSQTMSKLSELKSERTFWMGTAFVVSHQKLLVALSEYEQSLSEEKYSAFNTALDVFWSAGEVFNNPSSPSFSRTRAKYDEYFRHIHQELVRYDALMGRVKSGHVQPIEEIHASLKLLGPKIIEIQRYNFHSEAADINFLRDGEIDHAIQISWMSVLLFILILFGALLLYLRMRHYQRSVVAITEKNTWIFDLFEESNLGFKLLDKQGKLIFETTAMATFDHAREHVKVDDAEHSNLYSYEDDTHALGYDLKHGSGASVKIRMDMTDHYKYRRGIEMALNDQENATEAKADFLATMSHEMRTPLNGVLGLLGLLLDGTLDPEQKGYVLTARESGEILLSLIEDILDFSKIEAGKLEIETTDFSVSELVGGVCDMLAPKTFEKDIEISWHVDPAVPKKLLGDPGRLRQILLNLAGNAVKFTEKGGVTIEVALAADHEGEIILSSQISDTGIGIPYEAQDSMFGEFNQLDASFSRRFGGSGLGLAITRRLVEAMGGSIRLSSEPGRGSVFSFSVKLQKEMNLSDPSENTLEVASTHKSILFWGDNSLNNSLTLHSLQTMGHDVMHVLPTANLILASQSKVFDLIFMDKKPGANDTGYGSILNHVRDLHKASNRIPICVMQGTTTADVEKEFLAKNLVQVILQKPVHHYQIEDMLEQLDNPDHVPQSRVIQQNDTPQGRGERLLLVEDSSTNRMVAATILKNAGYQVDWVINGAEAVEAVQKLPYDVVLMDISMPVMDGEEASKIIRSLPGVGSKVPIIALTAHAMPGDRERFINVGMDDYLTKPLDKNTMLTTIFKYLPKPQGDPSLQPDELDLKTENVEDGISEEDGHMDYPILDMAVIDRMRLDVGDDSIPMLLDVFKEEVPLRVANIQAAFVANDMITLGREAHTLKSSSGSFGAMKLSTTARAIEENVRDDQKESLEKTMALIRLIAENTMVAYENLIKNM